MSFLRRGLPLLCVLALAGCGFGGDGSEGAGSVSEEKLALMPLPLDELGAIATGLQLDRTSGTVGNKEAARDSIDPRETALRLIEKGRVTGYKLSYTVSNPAAVRRMKGVWGVETSVELTRDEIYASGYLAKQIDDLSLFEGEEYRGIATLKGVSEFLVDAVGDEARGARATLSLIGLPVHGTTAIFRHGRVVGSVTVIRADKVNAAPDARRLAAALDVRIRDVLSGAIAGDPVSLPADERVDVRRMTLALADLPQGAKLVGTDAPKRTSHARDFDVANVRIGGSRFSELSSHAELMDDEFSAALYVRMLSRPEGRKAFARASLGRAARKSRGQMRVLSVDEIRLPGPDAAGMELVFSTPQGEMTMAMVLVRSGRAVGTVFGFGKSSEVDAADLVSLVAKARARLRTGARKG